MVGSAVGLGIVSFMAYQQHAATEMYRHHREEYCSTLSASLKEQKACIEEGISARNYLPWGYELLRWPEGITAWVIVATGLFIGWQAWETRKAAQATECASRAALLQIRLTKEKERARIEVKRGTLSLESVDSDFWYLKTTILIRNIGTSRSFIKIAKGTLFVQEEQTVGVPDSQDFGDSIDLPNGFIDSSAENDSHVETSYFFPDVSRALPGYASRIYNKDSSTYPRIRCI